MRERRVSEPGRLRRVLFSLTSLIRDPAGWSADHYRRKNRMDYVALSPERWGKKADRDKADCDKAGGQGEVARGPTQEQAIEEQSACEQLPGEE